MAAVGLILLSCTAAGFATGRFWNGADVDRLSFRTAIDAALDETRSDTSRRAALGQVYQFTAVGLRFLVENRDGSVLGSHAEPLIGQLEKILQE